MTIPEDPRAAERPDSAPSRPDHRPVGPLRAITHDILWIAAAGTVLVVLQAWPAAADEPGLLRWLRCCADHPWRSLCALLLALVALCPRRAGA